VNVVTCVKLCFVAIVRNMFVFSDSVNVLVLSHSDRCYRFSRQRQSYSKDSARTRHLQDCPNAESWRCLPWQLQVPLQNSYRLFHLNQF